MKILIPCSKKRREPPQSLQPRDQKRLKLNHVVKKQCGDILNMLVTHRYGWVFSIPVDPVKLDIPDYPSIISHPMDLGTIESKLEKDVYSDIEEFTADVRLTFSNAMLYNPPKSDVHLMAKHLDSLFSRKWKSLEVKWVQSSKQINQEVVVDGRTPTEVSKNPCHSLLPRTSMSYEDKKMLAKELIQVLSENKTKNLRSMLQKCGLICSEEGKIEKDIGRLDDETLWELKRLIKEPVKVSENVGRPLVKVISKGLSDGHKVYHGPARSKPSLSSVASNCGCGGVTCQCELQNGSASASSSGRSYGNRIAHCATKSKQPSTDSVMSSCGSCGCATCQCNLRHGSCSASSTTLSPKMLRGQRSCISEMESDMNRKPSSYRKESDPDSHGAVSTLDSRHILSSPHVILPASVEECVPPVDVPLSPNRALRAAKLKSRFVDTILKAKHTLHDQGNADPVKIRQEKERLQQQQREVELKIQAQIEAANAELKRQRERQREAARLAMEKMEQTANIDNNLEILDLEILSDCAVGECYYIDVNVTCKAGVLLCKPLEKLGLFLKEEYVEGNYGDDDQEEGEIIL